MKPIKDKRKIWLANIPNLSDKELLHFFTKAIEQESIAIFQNAPAEDYSMISSDVFIMHEEIRKRMAKTRDKLKTDGRCIYT